MPVEFSGERKVIIPGRALQEVSRIISTLRDDPESGKPFPYSFQKHRRSFSYGNAELTTRVVDGSYPDYTQIIPTQFATEVVVGRQELIKAVRTASLFFTHGRFVMLRFR